MVGDLLSFKMYDFKFGLFSVKIILCKIFISAETFSSVAFKISDFTPPLYFPTFAAGFNLARL